MTDKKIVRISTAYKKLNKLVGCSTLLRGHVISKADAACNIMGATEKLRIAASEVLNLNLLSSSIGGEIDIDKKDITFLVKWLVEHSISLGAYVFNKGNTDRYFFPAELLTFLKEKRKFYIEEFSRLTNTQQSDGLNFPITTDPELIVIEKLRVVIRELESDYVYWLTDSRVTLDVLTHIENGIPDFAEKDVLPSDLNSDLANSLIRVGRMIRTYHILNSLSNYFYWYMQFAWVKLYDKKEIREWQNTHVLEFNPN